MEETGDIHHFHLCAFISMFEHRGRFTARGGAARGQGLQPWELLPLHPRDWGLLTSPVLPTDSDPSSLQGHPWKHHPAARGLPGVINRNNLMRFHGKKEFLYQKKLVLLWC